MKTTSAGATIGSAVLSGLIMLGFLYLLITNAGSASAPTGATPSSVNLGILNDPIFHQLPLYVENSDYPFAIDPSTLSRDNPFAGY